MFSSILLLFALLFWVLRALFRSPQFLAFIARTKYNTYHAAVPCYPHLDVFWGLDLLFQTWRDTKAGQLSEGLRRRHETYGSTFIANNLGSTCIHTIDPENIHAITTGKFEDYGKSAWVQEAAKHIGCGILTNEGQAWKQSRLTLKPIFTRTALDEPAMVEPHIQGLIKHMQKLGQEEGVFDAHELLSMLALDLTTEFVFGKSTRCLQMPITSDGADGLHFLSLVEQFEKAAGTFFAVGSLAWLEIIPHLRRLKGVADGMKRFFSKNLADIVSAHGTRPQIDSERSKDKRSFTPPSVFRLMSAADIPIERIQGEMQNVFFASYDTTSAFLANLVGIIVRHPDVQTRLRDEIKFLDGTAPTNQDLAKMEYLRLVIMETLRLCTPVSSHSRQAKVDTTMPRGGGPRGNDPFIVQAGTTIVWSTYALNRSPELYGESWAEFRPDRWRDLLHRDAPYKQFFMPFGSGPRTCMGQQMVQNEVSYIIVRLLQTFSELRTEDDRPFREAKAVSYFNGHGLRISIR